MKESFVGVPTKLSNIHEIEVEEIENFSEYIKDLDVVEFENNDSVVNESV